MRTVWLSAHWPAAVATLIAAALLLWNLGLHPFWSDEAITAAYARSLSLHGGVPNAWDGRNLTCFGAGLSLTPDMYATSYPLLQFYLVWFFFAVFGAAEWAGRLPFALLGIATVPLTYYLGLRLFGCRRTAGVAAALLAISVSFLLFSRQCRYYGLTIFLSVLLLVLYRRLTIKRAWSIVAFTLAAILFFHSHFLMFYCFMGAMTAAYLAFDRNRERFWALLVSGVVLLALTIPWMLLFTNPYNATASPLASTGKVNSTVTLVWWYLRDMNRAAFFPIVAVLLLGAAIGFRWRQRKEDAGRALFLSTLVIAQMLLTAVVTGQTTPEGGDADLRYMVNLLPVMCVLLGFICAWVWALHRWVAAGLVVLLAGTNLLTLTSYRCFIADYLYEMTHPYKTSTALVVETLRERAQPDDLVLVVPDEPYDMRTPVIYYLGDKLRFCGILPADDRHILPSQKGVVPAYVYSGEVVPDWIVRFRMRSIRADISEHLTRNRVEYDQFVLPVYWRDQSRPEIIWHRFEAAPAGSYPTEDRVFIWHRTSR
jgi:4-amino-4-deoxy-L-arabinose transferase-like glycosyltransferase